MALLHVRLRDGHTHGVEAGEADEDAAIEAFIRRQGPFTAEWVPIATNDTTRRYVRYDEIVEVYVVHR